MMLVLTNVRGLVYSGCPRSCLMAHSDRGHPSVWSPGPDVPIAIKKKAGGLSPPRVPRGPPPLTRMKKNQEEEKAMTGTAMSLPGLPILVPRTAGSARPLSSTESCERRCPGSNLSSRDFVCKTECHSTSERGSRGEHETAAPCSTDPWPQPPNRTSLSTSFKIHSGVYRIYPKSTQCAWGSDEQRPTSGTQKGESTRRRSYVPVPAPLFISDLSIYMRWSWNCGAIVIPVVFSDPWTPSLRISPIFQPVTSVVPIGDTREENTADKEIGPAGPQTIPSP